MTTTHETTGITLPRGRTELHHAFAEIVENVTSRHPVASPIALEVCQMIMADERVSMDVLPRDLEREIDGLDDAGPVATYGQGASRVAAVLATLVHRTPSPDAA
jgi:hypothetical protein